MTLMNSSVGDEVQITSQGKMIKSFTAVQARQKETNINQYFKKCCSVQTFKQVSSCSLQSSSYDMNSHPAPLGILELEQK